MAVWIYKRDVLHWFVHKDSDCVSCEDEDGYTALQHAVKNGHEDVTVLLLAAGADPHLKGPEGSASEMAKKYKQLEHLFE